VYGRGRPRPEPPSEDQLAELLHAGDTWTIA
jgi:hypothetical protein